MASILFNKKIEKEPDLEKEYVGVSSGISATEGFPMSANSTQVLMELGINEFSHQSKKIKKADVEEAFLILTMTRSHKQSLVGMFPHAIEKTFTLKEYAFGEEHNIEDPFGMSIREYRSCAKEIGDALDKLIYHLKNFDMTSSIL
jgi:protein-tyrosine-phosphatase